MQRKSTHVAAESLRNEDSISDSKHRHAEVSCNACGDEHLLDEPEGFFHCPHCEQRGGVDMCCKHFPRVPHAGVSHG